MTATATPDAATTNRETALEETTSLSTESMQKLDDLATQAGWTLDETLSMAVAALKFALETVPSNEDITLYAYKKDRRYSMQITR